MKEVLPTIVPETFADLSGKVNTLRSFASNIHIDAVDGVFAPNTTWLPGEKLPDAQDIFYEAHLMVSDPHTIGINFARAGARRIIGHVEAFVNADAVSAAFDAWRTAGATEVGLALLIDTPLTLIEPYITHVDVVHLMTIPTIGSQGMMFDERSFARIEELHRIHPSLTISVDGGIMHDLIPKLITAGATRLSIGSAIQNADDPAIVYKSLLEEANRVY